MISLELADIFTNLVEVKKAEPDSRDSIMSLMRAARTLRDDPSVMESILKGKAPEGMKSIDEYSRGLITEYLGKGSISEYEEYSSLYSDDLIRFIRVTGLGRKRMLSIYDGLNIKDMEDLKDIFMGSAVDAVKAAGLDKDILNPLFAERIQKSVEYLQSIKELVPRWPAQYYAGKMLEDIEKMAEVERAEITGSIRRKKRLIGDIDMLVLPVFNGRQVDFGQSKGLLKKISQLPFVKKPVSEKRTGDDISGVYSTVYDVDLEVIIAARSSWAWQLVKTTGSKKHIGLLNDLAGDKRIELDTDTTSGCRTEKDVYGLLGLEYIPCELREGRDEVSLSLQKRLPNLVEAGDIKGDLHIHSKWSDGVLDYSEMVDSAVKMDYEYIAISDHSLSNYYGNGLDTARLLEKMEAVDKLKEKYSQVRILMGAEIDIKKPGKFDYDPDTIKKLDIAIASLHSCFPYSEEENTSRTVSALEKPYFDLAAHPTGIVFGNRAPLAIDMDKVIEAAAVNSKALEINSYYMRLDLNEENVRKAAAAGAKLAINTDSHRPGNMEMIELGVDIARRAGLEPGDIINTMTAEELMRWRRAR